MTQRELKILLDNYTSGRLNGEEKARLELWYLHQAKNGRPMEDPEVFQQRMSELDQAIFPQPVSRITTLSIWKRIVLSAACIIIVFMGILIYRGTLERKSGNQAATNLSDDVRPGKNGAKIITENGDIITLDERKEGIVIKGGLKYTDGTEVKDVLLSPEKGTGENSTKIVMLNAETLKGQNYRFILPDGTIVWLNSESRIGFPSSFSGSEQRNVTLQGEAYFEVAKDSGHPFRVISGKQYLDVLGTHFNVSAYPDETSVRTTLVEGSVRINDVTMLKPDQQSTFNGKEIKISSVDAGVYTDWKDGLFTFSNESLESVMKRIGRWYNVDIDYQATPSPKATYSGSISKFDNLSGVLRLLEKNSAVRFSVKNNKVTVHP